MNQERTEILKMVKFLRSIKLSETRHTYATSTHNFSDSITLQQVIDIANENKVPFNLIRIESCDDDIEVSIRCKVSDSEYLTMLRHNINSIIDVELHTRYRKLVDYSAGYVDSRNIRANLIAHYALNNIAIPEWLRISDYTILTVDELIETAKQVFEK